MLQNWNTFTQCCTSQENSKIALETFSTYFVIPMPFGSVLEPALRPLARQFWVTSAKKHDCTQQLMFTKASTVKGGTSGATAKPAAVLSRGGCFELWDRFCKRLYTTYQEKCNCYDHSSIGTGSNVFNAQVLLRHGIQWR